MTSILTPIVIILYWILQALWICVIIRFILSWIDPANNWRFSRVMRDVTEPVLAPIRRIIPPVGFLDLSAMVALVLLQVFIQMVRQLA